MSTLCKRGSALALVTAPNAISEFRNAEMNLNYLKAISYLIENHEEFLYFFVTSPTYSKDLKNLYTIVVPHMEEWNKIISSPYHHSCDKLKDNKEKFEKDIQQAEQQHNLGQKILTKITSILLTEKEIGVGIGPKANPKVKTLMFLDEIAQANMGYFRHEKSGLDQMSTLLNIFFVFSPFLKEMVFDKPISEFPFWCFFMRSSKNFDKQFNQLDRIGGSLSHLENELKDELLQFKSKQMTKQQCQDFEFVKSMILIFEEAVMPRINDYGKILEKIYVYHRALNNLTQRGLAENGERL